MKNSFVLFLFCSLFLSFSVPINNSTTHFSSPKSPPRTIITTDGEIDDVDSFIRMLLYSNEYRVEGLVYSSSMWHYKGDGKGTKMTSAMEMSKQLYGEKDFRVPVSEGMQAFQAAQLRNIPSRFIYLPEEGHWVGNPQTSVLWQRVFFEWLDKWLK
jgi:hypothetical protein